jgi:hypothetical protein
MDKSPLTLEALHQARERGLRRGLHHIGLTNGLRQTLLLDELSMAGHTNAQVLLYEFEFRPLKCAIDTPGQQHPDLAMGARGK